MKTQINRGQRTGISEKKTKGTLVELSLKRVDSVNFALVNKPPRQKKSDKTKYNKMGETEFLNSKPERKKQTEVVVQKFSNESINR